MVSVGKSKQIKRNHHYVWRFYLKSWAEGNELYYISKKGNVSRDSVKGLARETDFYKINPLTMDDVALIKRFSAMSPPFLQAEHDSQLKHFIRLSSVSNMISSSGCKSKDLNDIDKAIRHNSLEDMHSFYEDLSVKVIGSLSKGSASVLDNTQHMIAFCSYLGHQMSRTKSFKEKSLTAFKDNPDIAITFPVELKLLERNWWFISYMFGINIGAGLFESKNRNNHIFITNKTDIPFITSDHPIINIHPSACENTSNEGPSNADFYFPISPRFAYMINDSDAYNSLAEGIDSKMVNRLNKLIYEKSYENVFACSSEVLKVIMAHNNTNQ